MAKGVLKRMLYDRKYKPQKRSVQKRFEDDPQESMDFAKDVLGDDQVKYLRNEGLSDLQIAKERFRWRSCCREKKVQHLHKHKKVKLMLK